MHGYANRDESGLLRLVEWATAGDGLRVDLGPRSTPMAHGSATGDPLVSNGHLGVDVIRLAAGTGFAPHTHPGDHLLIVIGGEGTVAYDGRVYPTRAGQVYMIEGAIPHAVGAVTDHVILAVGSPHKPIGSPDRMTPVAYREIAAAFGDLSCLICDRSAVYPATLHDAGCPHCPCGACL